MKKSISIASAECETYLVLEKEEGEFVNILISEGSKADYLMSFNLEDNEFIKGIKEFLKMIEEDSNDEQDHTFMTGDTSTTACSSKNTSGLC